MARRRKRKQRSRRIYHSLLRAGCCGLVVLLLLGWWAWRNVFSVNPARYPVTGIDVSRHNGSIDFDRVSQAGVDFVYIKATEGVTYVDPNFSDNCRGAYRAGLPAGAYHYFSKHLSGERQARHFLQSVKGKHLQLPLVVDVEEWYNDDAHLNAELDRLEAMISELEQSGHRVMIYANRHDWGHYLKHRFARQQLWLSSFLPPLLTSGTPHVLHQYTFYGSVEGISGDVDLDVFVGSQAEWNAWLAD